MTLADAIRKGAAQRRHCRSTLVLYHHELDCSWTPCACRASVVATCAIGAAYEGLFGAPPATLVTTQAVAWLRPHFPELDDPLVFSEILRRNVTETREEIADWLETRGAR